MARARSPTSRPTVASQAWTRLQPGPPAVTAKQGATTDASVRVDQQWFFVRRWPCGGRKSVKVDVRSGWGVWLNRRSCGLRHRVPPAYWSALSRRKGKDPATATCGIPPCHHAGRIACAGRLEPFAYGFPAASPRWRRRSGYSRPPARSILPGSAWTVWASFRYPAASFVASSTGEAAPVRPMLTAGETLLRRAVPVVGRHIPVLAGTGQSTPPGPSPDPSLPPPGVRMPRWWSPALP